MRILVVYESLFGNTHEVAEAIGDGIRSRPDADVTCRPVAEAKPDDVTAADLLVVGGPTHMRGMTSGLSRKMGLRGEAQKAATDGTDFAPEPGAEGPGVRDWFDALPKAAGGSRAAAFDTRADVRLAGGAAHGIARRLRRHGYELVAEPEGFIIEDIEGPLRDGEHDRARAWGADLAQRAGRRPG
jgi:Flavodoxin